MVRRLLALSLLLTSLAAGGISVGSTAASAAQTYDGRIAFVRGGDVFTILPNGKDLQRLTTDGNNRWPRWSPDGERIAFVHKTRHGLSDLWVSNGDGTNRQRWTAIGTVSGADWSPDGQQFVLNTGQLSLASAVDPFGNRTVLETPDETDIFPYDGPPSWSPDGGSITFINADCYSPDYCLASLDVQALHVETYDLIGGMCCGFGYFANPAFSADSDSIFFTEARAYSDDNIVNFDPEPTQVKNRPLDGTSSALRYSHVPSDRQAAPAPSGDELVVTNNKTGMPLLYRVGIDDGTLLFGMNTPRTFLTRGQQADWQALSDPLPPSTVSTYFASVDAHLTPGSQLPEMGLADGLIPIKLGWFLVHPAGDSDCAVRGWAVDGSDSGWHPGAAPATADFSSTGESKNVRVAPPTSLELDDTIYGYDLVATDCGARLAHSYVEARPYLVDETGSTMVRGYTRPGFGAAYKGDWGVSNFTGWINGTTMRTTQYDAVARYQGQVTVGAGGGDVGLVMATGPDRGDALVFVDGQLTSLSTYAPIRRHRVVSASIPLHAGMHTIRVVNLATGDHPRIDMDALVFLNAVPHT